MKDSNKNTIFIYCLPRYADHGVLAIYSKTRRRLISSYGVSAGLVYYLHACQIVYNSYTAEKVCLFLSIEY